MATAERTVTATRFNWKVFFTLWVAAVIAVIASLPYVLTLQAPALERAPLPIPLQVLIPIQIAQNGVMFALVIAAGMFFAYRIGLGAPLLEGFFAGEDVRAGLKSILLPSIVLGVIAAVLIIVLDVLVFAPAVGLSVTPESTVTKPPAWQGLLVSLYGGIDEELLMRLFLLSMFAFIGKFVSHTPEGRPTLAVLWIANILVAILFGLGHLPITSAVVPITPLIVTRAIVLNGVGGLVFGYLYFTRGLESAILAHFSADIVLHVILAL